MAPKTVTELLPRLRARAIDGLAAVYGALLMRLGEPLLLRLERCGVPVPGVGWALTALAFQAGEREQPSGVRTLPPIVLLLALLQACSGTQVPGYADAGELDLADADDAGELDLSDADAGELGVLLREHARCAGSWADRDDSSTRYIAHPDTGLCSFACTWLEPRCDEPWYGDPRCFPAHDAVLSDLCAELGGECLEASDGQAYCEASSAVGGPR